MKEDFLRMPAKVKFHAQKPYDITEKRKEKDIAMCRETTRRTFESAKLFCGDPFQAYLLMVL